MFGKSDPILPNIGKTRSQLRRGSIGCRDAARGNDRGNVSRTPKDVAIVLLQMRLKKATVEGMTSSPAPQLSLPGIISLASAFHGSAVLFAALDLEIFSAIEKAGGAADCGVLAQALSLSPRGLRLLLDALAAAGLLAKDAAGTYRNTPAGRLALVPGAPADLTGAIAYNRDVYPLWGRLASLARTGEPVEPPALHLGDDPARTRRFALAMRSRAFAIGQGVLPMLDFSGRKRLLDLAGGPAAFAELLAKAYPALSVVTVDVPAIADIARELVAADGLADRIECRGGDYHADAYEEGAYDAASLFGCLHQESPDAIRAILAKAFAALAPGGRLYVLDMMTDATRTAPAFSAMFAVNMALTMPNGWVFSDAELKEWMREAGFVPGDTLEAAPPMPHWLVTADKPL